MAKDRTIPFQRSGAIGVVTDGDPYKRPPDTCNKLVNMDINSEPNKTNVRNRTVLPDAMIGFPTNLFSEGWRIRHNGALFFSFEKPVDSSFLLVALENNSGDLKLLVNKWFQPAGKGAENTYQDYENCTQGSGLRERWVTGWIDLTTKLTKNFTKVSDTIVDILWDSSFVDVDNYYRGWFIKSTQAGLHNEDKIMCIETSKRQLNESGQNVLRLTIQDYRAIDPAYSYLDNTINMINWVSGTLNLARYPVILDNTYTEINTVKMVKSNLGINIFIGVLGNLWFGFVDKDRIDTGISRNEHKWWGWWLDTITPTNAFTSEQSSMFTAGVANGFLIRQPATTQVYLYPFHWYSRRIRQIDLWTTPAGASISSVAGSIALDGISHFCFYKFSSNANLINVVDPLKNAQYFARPYGTPASMANVFLDNTASMLGEPLSAYICYLPNESPATADTMATLTKDGALFVAGEEDKNDRIGYSAIQLGRQEQGTSIFPKQNRRAIGGSGLDRIRWILNMQDKVAIVKDYNIFIIAPKDTGGYRILNTVGDVGSKYYKAIIETDYGIVLANDDSVFLYPLGNKIDLLQSYRRKEYLALDKTQLVAKWFPARQEMWLKVSSNQVWLMRISLKDRLISWRNYTFPNSWTIVDFLLDEDGYMHIATENNIVKMLKDNENTDIADYGELNGVSFEYEENLQVIPEKVETRTHRFLLVESKIYFESEDNNSIGTQDVTVKVYKNTDSNPMNTRQIFTIPKSRDDGTIIIRHAEGQGLRGFKFNISGQLTNKRELSFSEIRTAGLLLPQPIKAGVNKVW